MDLPTFELLLTPAGQSALATAMEGKPQDADFLPAFEKLRKRHPAELAKAGVETAILRGRAASKFPHAERMYFIREALEQASSNTVAAYRAGRFRPFARVADFCCGVGGDAIALAEGGCEVVAVDRDPLRARMAEANVAACGLAGRCRVEIADVLTHARPAVDAFFCDPSRRSDGKRYLSPADYEPPPAAVIARFPRRFPAAFKLAPGVPLDALEGFAGEIEFISLGGELKECVLWLGPLRTAVRRATALPGGQTLAADEVPLPPEVGPPLRYVYDPDPSVTRSGLVALLAEQLEAYQLDDRVAVLTSDRLVATPFATAYAVEAALPVHPKKLREFLRSQNVGRVTPVKRGSAVDTDDLVRGLKLRGDGHRTLLFTQAEGRAVVLVAERIVSTSDGDGSRS